MTRLNPLRKKKRAEGFSVCPSEFQKFPQNLQFTNSFQFKIESNLKKKCTIDLNESAAVLVIDFRRD